MSKKTEEATPAFKMIESLSLRSTGRTVHMGTVVIPVNQAEADELLAFSKLPRPVCKLNTPPKPTDGAGSTEDKGDVGDTTGGDQDAPDADDPLLAVPGIGKKTFSKLKELGITTPDQLKAAVMNEEQFKQLSEAVGAPNAAKWKTHFDPKPDAGANAQGDVQPRSSREQK